jgi:hypothetical protein
MSQVVQLELRESCTSEQGWELPSNGFAVNVRPLRLGNTNSERRRLRAIPRLRVPRLGIDELSPLGGMSECLQVMMCSQVAMHRRRSVPRQTGRDSRRTADLVPSLRSLASRECSNGSHASCPQGVAGRASSERLRRSRRGGCGGPGCSDARPAICGLAISVGRINHEG